MLRRSGVSVKDGSSLQLHYLGLNQVMPRLLLEPRATLAPSQSPQAELSVSGWRLMLSVRCQVELSGPQKEDSIVCESPGHCHTTFLAARRDGTGRLLK